MPTTTKRPAVKKHGPSCSCPPCRHARFEPGPASKGRKARAAILPYGHGRTHPKKPRA